MKYKVKPVRYWFPAVEVGQRGPGLTTTRLVQPTHMQIYHQTLDTRIGN